MWMVERSRSRLRIAICNTQAWIDFITRVKMVRLRRTLLTLLPANF